MKTADEMRISDWSSDVCASDLQAWHICARRGLFCAPGKEFQLTVPSVKVEFRCLRGNSSVGRARPCQGRGREFESRFPLQIWQNPGNAGVLFFRRNAPPSVPPAIRVSSIRSSKSPAWWQSGYAAACKAAYAGRSEEHTSELQSLMRISYAVFCLKKKQ